MTAPNTHIIHTAHKPLTKGWANAQLAGAGDVEVLITPPLPPGGTGQQPQPAPAAIQSIDPLKGVITLVDPVPQGSKVVVHYYYMDTPFDTRFLSNPNGIDHLGFNQFAHKPYQVWGDSTPPAGGGQTPPLPMTAAYHEHPQPALLGYTHTAFQRAYTATMNDPTTLLFNEPTGGHTGMHRALRPEYIMFEGDDYPRGPQWRVTGQWPGDPPAFEEGLFVVEDLSTAGDVATPDPLFYSAKADFSFEYALSLNFRLKVFDYHKDGDFTGVAAGWAGGKHLYFLGFLEKDGFKFAGFFGNQQGGDDESQRHAYHGISAIVQGPGLSTLEFSAPHPLVVGQRLMVDGEHIRTVVFVSPAGHSIGIDAPVPFGTLGQHVNVFPEIDHGQLTSYRVHKDGRTGVTRAFAMGATAPFAEIRDHERPQTPEIFELLRANEAFFGSLSRRATNRSGWDFYRLSILPANPSEQRVEVSVQTPFHVLPSEDPDPDQVWAQTDNQGYALIGPNGKAIIQQAGRDSRGAFAYHRVEPFLDGNTLFTLDAQWRVYHSEAGMPWHLVVSDGRKEITLCLYTGQDSTPPSIPLFDLNPEDAAGALSTKGWDHGAIPTGTGGWVPPNPLPGGGAQGSLPASTGAGAGPVSSKGRIPGDSGQVLTTRGHVEDFHDYIKSLLTQQFRMNYPGVRPFYDEGWREDFSQITSNFVDHAHNMQKSWGATGWATKEVAFPPDNVPIDNYVTSLRLRVNEADPDALVFRIDDGLQDINITFGRDASGVACLRFLQGGPASNDYVKDAYGADIEIPWAWDDGGYHAYRVRRHGSYLTIFVDGNYLSWVSLALFPSSARTGSALTGVYLREGEVNADLDFWFLHANLYGKRWVGLYNGAGHPYDPGAYDYIEHDWLNTDFRVKITHNPAGKTIIDLGAGQSFERQYFDLPDTRPRARINSDLGYVYFGAMQPGTHAYTECEHLNYTIRSQPVRKRRVFNSLFNWAWPETSPEFVFDDDPEEFLLETSSSDPNKILLSPYGIKARHVLAVMAPDKVTPVAGGFTFDKDSNEITLTGGNHSPGGDHTTRQSLWVTLLHGRPFGKRYLKAQGVPHVKLGPDTPAFWRTQSTGVLTAPSDPTDTRLDEQGDRRLKRDFRLLSDPDVDWAADHGIHNIAPGTSITLEDGELKVSFATTTDALYDSMDLGVDLFSGQTSQRLLAPACDEGGWVQMGLSGWDALQDVYQIPASIGDCLNLGQITPSFVLDDVASLLDDAVHVLDLGIPPCNVSMGIHMEYGDPVGPITGAVQGELGLYEGLILDAGDKHMDTPEDCMDTYTLTSQIPMDFVTPYP